MVTVSVVVQKIIRCGVSPRSQSMSIPEFYAQPEIVYDPVNLKWHLLSFGTSVNVNESINTV